MASPDFQIANPYDAATGITPVHAPKTTVPVGGTKRFTLTHRSRWVIVLNVGPADLTVGFGPDAASGTGGAYLLAGAIMTVPATVTEVVIGNAGAADGAVSIIAGVGEEPAGRFKPISVSHSYPSVVVSGDDTQLGVD